MQKINFKNLPDTSTPLNATNLNQMQDNIETAINTVAGDIPTVVDSLTGSSTTDAPSVHAVNDKFNTIASYSTTETVIGTWIDKPLYRKVIETTALPNTGVNSYSTGIQNVNKIVRIYGYCSNNLFINGVRPEDRDAEIGAWFDTNEMKVKISTGRDRSNLTATVILEYTKTTD